MNRIPNIRQFPIISSADDDQVEDNNLNNVINSSRINVVPRHATQKHNININIVCDYACYKR
jgi:hypothetical protein